MKKWVFLILIGAILGWVVFDLIQPTAEQENIEKYKEETGEEGNRKGDTPYDFKLTTLDGDEVNLSDYKGEKIMLNFWATWCPPCRAEMPDMQKFQEEHDVTVLAVNLTDTEQNLTKVIDFINHYELDFTVPLDEKSDVANLYGIVAYPTTFMIDSKNRIQFIMMGAMNYEMMVKQFEMLE